MSFARNQEPSTFPAVPASLSAGDYGMQDYYAAQDTQRQTAHTLPGITPYLGLRARLSQVWINRWTILLLLVLARTLIAVTGINHDLSSAKTQALSACSGIEATGSALASMPHYLASGVNELTASGVEKAVGALMSMLLMTVTGVEEIVTFYINMLTSTYVCLITFAVGGAMHVAIQLAEDVTNFLNKTIGGLETDIVKGVGDFENDLTKFLKALNSVPEIFGKTSTVPTLDLTSELNGLNHITIPADTIDQGLGKLNSSIPTFADVNNFTNFVIRSPFEEVKKLINESIHFSFNRSVLPVPQKEQLTFCSDNNGISDFFDDLAKIANLARKIFIIVLLIAAILACVPMAYRDIMRWRTMQKRALLVSKQATDPMDVIYIASRPITASAGLWVGDKFHSTRGRHLARWFMAYITSLPALFILSLGVAGLFSCLCQYILLRAIEKEVPALVNEVGDFVGKVVSTLEDASDQWANGTNQAILAENTKINHDVFGWVNTTTGAINGTLNAFTTGMTDTLNKTFGGTVLYDPIQEVINCLIGLKIAGIEKALTWVSDNAQVTFSLLPNDTFSLGAKQSIGGGTNNILSSPTTAATDEITAAVKTVTDHIQEAIRTEALISTAILILWLCLILMGLGRVCYASFGRDKSRAEGGPSYAGDIPLDPQRPLTPSPAYEYPQPPTNNPTVPSNAQPATRFASFQTPMSGTNVERQPSSASEDDFQDRKLGFAGERSPVQRVEGGGNHIRGSSYGVLGNEKR